MAHEDNEVEFSNITDTKKINYQHFIKLFNLKILF